MRIVQILISSAQTKITPQIALLMHPMKEELDHALSIEVPDCKGEFPRPPRRLNRPHQVDTMKPNVAIRLDFDQCPSVLRQPSRPRLKPGVRREEYFP